MARDRRKHDRVPVDVLTQIECRSDKRNALGHTTEISVGGVCLVTPLILDCGTEVDMRFSLSPGAPKSFIETVGIVVRADSAKREMRIRFRSLDPELQLRLENFVASHK